MRGETEKVEEVLAITQVPAHLLRLPSHWPVAVALTFASSLSFDSSALPLVQASHCRYARQPLEHPPLGLLQATRREERDASLYDGDVFLDRRELHRAPAVYLLLHPDHLSQNTCAASATTPCAIVRKRASSTGQPLRRKIYRSSDYYMLPAMLPGVRSETNLAYDRRLSITLIGLCEPLTRWREHRHSSRHISAAPCSPHCSEGRKACAARTITE
jgi:hypothetical protein